MRTLLPLLVMLLTATATVANVPPPGNKYLRYFAVITLAEPAGEWVYFVEPSDGFGLRKLGQGRPFVIPSPGWSGTFTKPSVIVWAVRIGDVAELTDEAVEHRLSEWHRKRSAVCSGRIELGYWGGSLFDVSDGIEKHYQIERTETELKLHPIGERTSWNGFVLIIVCGAAAVGIVLLVAWLTWRWRKRKARLTRTVPPPGT